MSVIEDNDMLKSVFAACGITSIGPVGSGCQIEYAWSGKIPADAFCNLTVTKVIIGKDITSIGQNAFSSCDDLTDLTIEKGVQEIENSAFGGATSLTDLYYGGTKEEWETITIGNPNFENVTIHYTEEVPVANPFTDVPEWQYYYNPVLWALKEGVTSGVSATEFGPDQACTRAQVVTFLWRANGCPTPTSSTNPFTDVPAGQYYTDAVLWAVEKGITSGTSLTTFEPDATVTRGQFVTFLYRAEGSPSCSNGNPFTDVYDWAYYYKPVLWAYENGVASGTSAITFGPEEACTRGQVVTFLYRAYN